MTRQSLWSFDTWKNQNKLNQFLNSDCQHPEDYRALEDDNNSGGFTSILLLSFPRNNNNEKKMHFFRKHSRYSRILDPIQIACTIRNPSQSKVRALCCVSPSLRENIEDTTETWILLQFKSLASHNPKAKALCLCLWRNIEDTETWILFIGKKQEVYAIHLQYYYATPAESPCHSHTGSSLFSN